MDGLISRGLKTGGGLKSGILRYLEVFEKFRKLEEIQKKLWIFRAIVTKRYLTRAEKRFFLTFYWAGAFL